MPSTAANFDTGFQELTVELWAQLNGPQWNPDYQALIAKTDGSGFPQDSVMILRGWEGAAVSVNIQPGDDPTGYISMGTPSVGVWHHLAATMSGLTGEQRTYLDGNLVTTFTKQPGPVNNQARSLYFGRLGDWPGKYYDGLLDEVRFYNRVLSGEEIRAHYDQGTMPAAPSITVQPSSQKVLAGANVTFSVTASGTEPLSYQWQYLAAGETNGMWMDLADGDRVSGTTTATLTISSFQPDDAGQYRVVVNNAYGSVSSSNAALTLLSITPGEPYPVTSLEDSGVGSLRAAIDYANTNAGPDRIIFYVAGTINLLSPLTLNDASGGTIIDGTQVPGFSGTPLVVLSASGGPGATNLPIVAGIGLMITSASNEVRALQISFFETGIEISGAGASANVIVGSYIGTDGSNPLGNGNGIVVSDASGNRIGTDSDGVNDEGERNIISGNYQDGSL